MLHRKIAGVTAFISATSLSAGEVVLYDAAPDWIDEIELDADAANSGTAILLLDQHARIDDGQLWTYVDTAILLNTPQALT
ncbi:hypothetical protein [Erythrobacter sp.]|jgi:hypothetical protein|uniref:hypothetical protein n=1 Tax=Erythrobacter sp. TaxID=1042 RepID=UPI002E9D92E8|nr:hypothetical protein [Erythrobacter sp.]